MLYKFQKLNYLLIFLVLLIAFIGAAGLYSAAGGSYNPWASRHLIRMIVLLSLAVLISLIDIKLIYKYAYLIFILSFLLLFSVELIGVFGKGATRWISIFGFSLQPSEIVKITIILALARFYHDLKFEEVKKISHLFFPFLIFYLKNFSTALGATERIPLLISVWAPVLILSIFCSVGILQIYDK